MRDAVMKTEKLTKRYGGFTALEDVNMTVYKGDIYGLIGRNGAGKTTIMKLITGLTGSTSGEIELFGKKRSRYQRRKETNRLPDREPGFLW